MMRLAVALLLLLACSRPVLAAERPDAENMGKLLAYTVNCGCVVGEKAWILETYRAVFADAYGQGFANALQAPLQGALMDGWDRNMSLCKRICDQPVTRELQMTLARADGGTVDGASLRALLGPAPAHEPAANDVVAAGGETATVPVEAAAGVAVPQQGEAEARLVFPPQSNVCVYRNYARGCTPAEGEVPVAVAVEPAVDTDSLEAIDGASPGQAETVLPAPAEAEVVVEAEAVVATSVESAYQAPEAEAETSSGASIDALYTTAGSGDNWSTSICRASPSRPDCRKPGAE